MTLDLYRRLLAELGDYLFEIEFYNWGEPLLASIIYDHDRRGERRAASRPR